jgi:Mn-dependent DtxR family transcriptional regulator
MRIEEMKEKAKMLKKIAEMLKVREEDVLDAVKRLKKEINEMTQHSKLC